MSNSYDGVAVVYHHVTDKFVDIDESCKCTIEQFKSGLESLKSKGYVFKNLDDAISIIDKKEEIKFALVTFDDVPENVYYNAYPYLKQNQIPFVLFITTSFIGKSGYLSKEQIKEMLSSGLCTIGAHTINHPFLRKTRSVLKELEFPISYFKEEFDVEVKYLAYPFGRHSSVSPKVQRLARKVGYRCAFSTIESHISKLSSWNRYFIPRIVIK